MERARATLPKIAAEILRNAPAGEAPYLAWPLVCGSTVAARTKVVELSDGIMRIEVLDPLWRAQLLGLTPQYLAALNQLLGQQIAGIRFVLPEGSQGNKR